METPADQYNGLLFIAQHWINEQLAGGSDERPSSLLFRVPAAVADPAQLWQFSLLFLGVMMVDYSGAQIAPAERGARAFTVVIVKFKYFIKCCTASSVNDLVHRHNLLDQGWKQLRLIESPRRQQSGEAEELLEVDEDAATGPAKDNSAIPSSKDSYVLLRQANITHHIGDAYVRGSQRRHPWRARLFGTEISLSPEHLEHIFFTRYRTPVAKLFGDGIPLQCFLQGHNACMPDCRDPNLPCDFEDNFVHETSKFSNQMSDQLGLDSDSI
eukprot:s460_g14.t1